MFWILGRIWGWTQLKGQVKSLLTSPTRVHQSPALIPTGADVRTHELAWEALTLGRCLFWTFLTQRLLQLSAVQPGPWQLPSCCGAAPGCTEPPWDPGSPAGLTALGVAQEVFQSCGGAAGLQQVLLPVFLLGTEFCSSRNVSLSMFWWKISKTSGFVRNQS